MCNVWETNCRIKKKSNLSCSELVKKIGLTTRSVTKWENDEAAPSADTIVLLAKEFHVTADYILGIETKDILSLEGLPEADRHKIRAMLTAYINITLENR